MVVEQLKRETKELVCQAEWMRRYFSAQARKYSRWDYRIRTALALTGIVGAALVGIESLRLYAGILAGLSAFALGTVLPTTKWDDLVKGFKEEQEAWTQIHLDAEDLERMIERDSDRDELLVQIHQSIRDAQKEAALDERYLPKDDKLLAECEQQTREYYSAAA